MTDYTKWTVKFLKEFCKEKKIKIPSGTRKADIVSLIEEELKNIKPERILDPLTKRRQKIIKKALLECRKEGSEEILDYFKRRNENKRLKQTFDIYKLNLKNPNTNEIRACLKYFQEMHDYNKGDRLLLNQMIAQPKYIDLEYIDPRLVEFKQFEIDSYTYDIPVSKANKRKSLNRITES